MYKRFDNGLGVIKSNKKELSKWVCEFNNLHENIFIDKCHFGYAYIQEKYYFQHRKIKYKSLPKT